MKLFYLALRSAFLSTCYLVLVSFAPVMAANSATQETSAYQSSFDGYKPLSDDNLSDWKSINVPSNGGGHVGHSMAGMQHKMSPEQMAKIPSDSKEIPSMKGMDHSSMEGIKKMAPDNMKAMDHSQIDYYNMKSTPDSKSAMQPMQKEDMPEMNHDEMAGHDHGGSGMKAMDHLKMNESKPNDTQPNHEGAVQYPSEPHEHASIQGSEHAGMSMPSMAAPATQAIPLQIIPNFHPIVVHFPIALTVIAFLLSIAAYARRSHPVSTQLAAAGHFTLWLAAIGAAVAVLFGWLAFNSVNHDDAGHAAMLLHRSWAIPTALGLILLASWDAWKYRINELISVPMLFILFLLFQAIAVTGWLGGEVVYRHGIGVLSIPSSEGAGHGHHHGADATAPSHTTGKTEPDVHTDHLDDEKGESHAH